MYFVQPEVETYPMPLSGCGPPVTLKVSHDQRLSYHRRMYIFNVSFFSSVIMSGNIHSHIFSQNYFLHPLLSWEALWRGDGSLSAGGLFRCFFFTKSVFGQIVVLKKLSMGSSQVNVESF